MKASWITSVLAVLLLAFSVGLSAQQPVRLTLPIGQSLAQVTPPPSFGRHRVYFELLGNTALGTTVNYEYGLSQHWGVRVGVGLDLYSGTTIIPVTLSALAGSGSSKFEIAGGFLVANELSSGNWHWDGRKIFLSLFIGYRYQPRKGFMFRLGMIPLFWTNNQIPWVGLSLGVVS